jgi:hypothetical protein
LKHPFFTQEEPRPCLPSQYFFTLLPFRLPNLDGEDYHEFIVKQEKKLQITYKKRFAFAKPYQSKWTSFEEETKDYWKPAFDAFNNKKKVLLHSTLVGDAPMTVEEARALPIKPFQNPQLVA